MNDILSVVLTQLDNKKGQWKKIAKEAGVPDNTVYRIGNRETKNPRFENVQKLYSYFQNAS